MKNRQGFTLLELIVVITIMGVLASLALPRLSDMVKASYAPEAIQDLTTIHSSMQRCLLMKGKESYDTFRECHPYLPSYSADFGKIDIDEPFNAPGSHFDYKSVGFTSAVGFSDGACYLISAKSSTDANDFILFQYCNVTHSGNIVGVSGPDGDFLYLKAYAGITIAGSGVFKNVKIGPGITDWTPFPF